MPKTMRGTTALRQKKRCMQSQSIHVCLKMDTCEYSSADNNRRQMTEMAPGQILHVFFVNMNRGNHKLICIMVEVRHLYLECDGVLAGCQISMSNMVFVAAIQP